MNAFAKWLLEMNQLGDEDAAKLFRRMLGDRLTKGQMGQTRVEAATGRLNCVFLELRVSDEAMAKIYGGKPEDWRHQ